VRVFAKEYASVDAGHSTTTTKFGLPPHSSPCILQLSKDQSPLAVNIHGPSSSDRFVIDIVIFSDIVPETIRCHGGIENAAIG